MNNKRTIIYVNFIPYENTGKILDFLLDRFENVLLFSLNFYQLHSGQYSKLIIYKSGIAIKEYKLGQVHIPPNLIFILLPLRSLHILIQVIVYLLKLKKEYLTYDVYFSVNAFTIWIGNLLKKLGLVKRTVFWVWDYYPPNHKNKVIMLMRWFYWQFDKRNIYSDKVVFLNERLQSLRKDIGILPYESHYAIVPIGTNPSKMKKQPKRISRLVFLGVVKKSQGLELLIDNLGDIIKLNTNIKIDIIGSGPDVQYLKHKASAYGKTVQFHGYISSEIELNKLLARGDIGLATYIPEESNVSYYGDPSKIKAYLNFGIPVITTSMFQFSEEIQKYNAGIIIDYYKPEQLAEAIKEIESNYSKYRSGAVRLAQKYNYKKIYPRMFEV